MKTKGSAFYLETDTLLGKQRGDVLAALPQEEIKPYRISDEVKTPAFAFLNRPAK